MQRIPPFLIPVLRVLRNFYFLTGTAFLVWMLLFDGNDLGKQYDMYRKWRELQAEKEYYESSIESVKHDRAELLKVCPRKVPDEAARRGRICARAEGRRKVESVKLLAAF
jgi:hypothetical protein